MYRISVITAKAGIQSYARKKALDPGFRRDDVWNDNRVTANREPKSSHLIYMSKKPKGFIAKAEGAQP